MRNIVTLKKIDQISPIENADRIVTAKIGGWNIIVKKDEFTIGETVVYFEVDTALPVDVEQFEFLSGRGVKTVVNPDNVEVQAHVLKTMKMRGVISQGLVLALSDFGLSENATQDEVNETFKNLGVFKYEPPLPLGGGVVGPFPTQARKTDSERVQNLTDVFLQGLNKDEWYASEKIDGTSSTFVKRDGKLVVASRNWEVSPTDSAQAKIADKLGMFDLMPEGSVIQGEIFGEGVNKNPLKIQGTRLMVFNASSPVQSDEFDNFINEHSVPVLDMVLPDTVDEAVEQVFKMKSIVNPSVYAEGVVWWNRNGETFNELGDRPNFKAINNHYLMKHDG